MYSRPQDRVECLPLRVKALFDRTALRSKGLGEAKGLGDLLLLRRGALAEGLSARQLGRPCGRAICKTGLAFP